MPPMARVKKRRSQSYMGDPAVAAKVKEKKYRGLKKGQILMHVKRQVA